MKHKLHLLFIAVVLLFSACESATSPGGNAIIIAPAVPTLFVVNEGDYDHNNSSLDAVLFKPDTVKDTIHNTTTIGTDTILDHNILSGMGEGNDVLVTGNHVIVLDNGANTLKIVNADSLTLLATIPFGLAAPNKMALIAPNMLFVTRRNGAATRSAAIVDLTKNAIVDSIPLQGESIAVAILNNKAYVTSSDSGDAPPYLLNVVNLSTFQVEKTIPLPESPEQAIADSANGDVIIGAETDYVSIPPKFYFVNATSDAITDSLSVGAVNDDAELTTGSKHFIVLNGLVYPLSGPTHTLAAPLINSSSLLFFKGFYDATSNQLYVGEYNFNVANGKVDVYDGSTGTFKWSFATGIGPAHFAFYH